MALIKCPRCGGKISNKNTICVHCGHKLIHQEERFKKDKTKTAITEKKRSIEPLPQSKNMMQQPMNQVERQIPRKPKKARKIVLTILGGVVGLAIILVILDMLLPSLIAGSFDEETAQSFEVHNLKCYAPEGWEMYADSQDDRENQMAYLDYGDEDEIAASIKTIYLGDTDDIQEAIDVIQNENDYIRSEEGVPAEMEGCKEAIQFKYTTQDYKYEVLIYFIKVDSSIFYIRAAANPAHYDEKEFNKIIGSFDFSDYSSKHTCKYDGCRKAIAENKNYCKKHQCVLTNCSEGMIVGEKYCQKHWESEGFGNGVPDFYDITGIEFDYEASSVLNSFLYEDMSRHLGVTHAYYLDNTEKYLAKEYESLLIAKGFKLTKTTNTEDGKIKIYDNGDVSILYTYADTTTSEKGDKLVTIDIFEDW